MKRWTFLSLVLAGCAAAPIGPFQNFQTSVKSAQSGLEAEMDRDVSWEREAEIQSVSEKKDAVLSGYMLKSTEGFQWTMGHPPEYWGARGVQKTLVELNAAFLGYASLLSSVVSGETADEARFDAMASNLNKNLRGLSDTLVKMDRLPKADKERAPVLSGFSAAVSEAFRAFIQNRRLKDLKAAIDENQPWVDTYSSISLSLIELIRADLKAAYADQMDSIQTRWDDKRAPGRATLTRSLFNLNEEYVDAMASLESLSAFYGDLPAAHRELGATIRRGEKGRKALSALVESAGRVARLQHDLVKGK